MYSYIYTAFTMIKAQFDYSLGNLQSFFVYMLQEELYHKSSLKIANIPGFSIPVIF